MFALKHPWFTAVAGLGLTLGLATAMDTSAPALRLASDAVVMPSAAPLPETPVEPAATQFAEEPLALTDEAEEQSLAGAFEVPEGFAGPPEPAGADLDCVDFENTPFPIDPNDDPHGLDADSDGLACEPPPSD
ncbi:hypothetical protein [Micromonospora sp. CPCC 206061]|uniref:hypothetical protein n=1 Tax=Micromonospora sp. CPCC 206061 TaxID=3122410 RepID=UPI002FF2CA89